MNRRLLRSLSRDQIKDLQLQKLSKLIDQVRQKNKFYADLWKSFPETVTWEWFTQLPTFDKRDLVTTSPSSSDVMTGQSHSSAPNWLLSGNHTFTTDQYVRAHRTSGTSGRPMMVLDTAEDWQWWLDTWQYVLDSANVD